MNTVVGFGLALVMAAAPNALAAAPPVRQAQGYLGVDVRDIAPDEVAALKLKDTHGAEIVLVDHDAPAGKCGLREHDVVLMMNGQAIDDQDQLRRMLHESPPGRTVVLVLTRAGQQMTVTAQMAVSQEDVERQAAEQRLAISDPQDQATESLSTSSASSSPTVQPGNSLLGPIVMNPSYTGLYLEKMSSQLADYFGVPNGNGLLVRSVQDNSPAALAGMHAGDVVVEANARTVASTGDWSKAIKNSHGRPLTIVILRDKKEQTLTLTPDGKKRSSLDQPTQGAAPFALAHLGLTWMPRS